MFIWTAALLGLLQTVGGKSAEYDMEVVDRAMDLTRCAKAAASELDDRATSPEVIVRAAFAECSTQKQELHAATERQVRSILRTHTPLEVQLKSEAAAEHYRRSVEDQIILHILRHRAAKR